MEVETAPVRTGTVQGAAIGARHVLGDQHDALEQRRDIAAVQHAFGRATAQFDAQFSQLVEPLGDLLGVQLKHGLDDGKWWKRECTVGHHGLYIAKIQ